MHSDTRRDRYWERAVGRYDRLPDACERELASAALPAATDCHPRDEIIAQELLLLQCRKKKMGTVQTAKYKVAVGRCCDRCIYSPVVN